MILKDAIIDETAQAQTQAPTSAQIDLEDAIRASNETIIPAVMPVEPPAIAQDVPGQDVFAEGFTTTRAVPLTDIIIKSRKRLVDENWVAALAQDFSKI
jgi:hypothetical protein